MLLEWARLKEGGPISISSAHAVEFVSTYFLHSWNKVHRVFIEEVPFVESGAMASAAVCRDPGGREAHCPVQLLWAERYFSHLSMSLFMMQQRVIFNAFASLCKTESKCVISNSFAFIESRLDECQWLLVVGLRAVNSLGFACKDLTGQVVSYRSTVFVIASCKSWIQHSLEGIALLGFASI